MRRSLSPLPEENEGIVELDKQEIMKLKLYKDQIKRTDLPMDKQRNFTQENVEGGSDKMARTAKYN